MKEFPTAIQTTWKNCGPTCVRIITEFYGLSVGFDEINEVLPASEDGVTLLEISDALNNLGFRTTGFRCDFETLKNEIKLPCIAHWENWHYVVIYKITDSQVLVSDPASGLRSFTRSDFVTMWTSDDRRGVVLSVEAV